MKILHLVKTSVGASWVYHQVRVLRSLGIEVAVALPSETEGWAPHYRKCGATLIRANLDFPSRRPWRLPAVLRACRELVDQVRPDLIHSHFAGTTYVLRLALGKKSRIPRIFQVPGPLHLEHRLYAWIDTHLAGPLDHWIATCRWTQQKYLQLGIPPARVHLSYVGTEISQFRTERGNKLRKEYDIPADTPLVGMVAYMYPPKFSFGQTRGLKGHEDFFAALNLVRKRRPDVRGVIVGGPWGNARWYERRIRSLGARLCGSALIFTGHRTDIPEIYPDLDLAVVPSLSENLGGAVEPLLSGVPVVATNVGGLPDIVQEGKTGWLVPPRRPADLARAMLAALDKPEEARRRTSQGQKLARRLMDVEKTGREVAAIYEAILCRTDR